MKTIETLKAVRGSDGSGWESLIKPEASLVAVLELADELENLKAQVASGLAGAKISDIDPDRIAKTNGQV